MTLDELTTLPLGDMLALQTRIVAQSRDNIFSANHRNAMIQKYGYTEAMRITIGDLTGEV